MAMVPSVPQRSAVLVIPETCLGSGGGEHPSSSAVRVLVTVQLVVSARTGPQAGNPVRVLSMTVWMKWPRWPRARATARPWKRTQATTT